MSKIFKIVLLAGVLAGSMLSSFADRGINKRAKNRISLNISTERSFKNSLSFNLNTGLRYTGSMVVNTSTSPFITNSIVSYQKGNAVYILPVKQKVFTSEVKQGYAGMKLIIRHR